MSIIYIDQLAVRLPSEARNAFNPSYAFSGAGGRSAGQVMGLREVQSGHILLPMDADGTIVVTPGQHYSVVIVRETKFTSSPATNDATGVAMNSGNGGESNKKIKNQQASKKQQQNSQKAPEQPQKQLSAPHEAALETKQATEQSQPAQQQQHHQQQKDHPSKQERKAARTAPAAAAPPPEPQLAARTQLVNSTSIVEVHSPSPAAEVEQPSKKKKRHETSPSQHQQQQQQQQVDAEHRHVPTKTSSSELSPQPSSATTQHEDADDVPFMQVFAASQLHTSSSSGKLNSKRGSPSTKPEETSVAPPPPVPVRRGHSSSCSSRRSSSRNSDDGSRPFSQLYSAPASASTGKTDKEDVTAPMLQQQLHQHQEPRRPGTVTVATPKRSPKQSLHQQLKPQHSPETVPLTLPPSGHGSLMRRVPLDASSDSESD